MKYFPNLAANHELNVISRIGTTSQMERDQMSQVKQLLTGHVSPETAFVVADYPYGFTLRCQIRYWLEYKRGHGVRLMSQTTNPKRPGIVWNKPKGSTYCRFGGAMFLDENDHVQWSGMTEYGDAAEAEAWIAQFGSANHPDCVPVANGWLEGKRKFEALRDAGKIEMVVTSRKVES